MRIIPLQTIEDTQALAEDIAGSLKGGEVLALSGDLGSGKTTFTQFLARELGVKGTVNSPTFVIMKQYHTTKHPLTTLVHVDAYRLSHEDELMELGIDQHINASHSVVIIEWADKIKDYLQKLDTVLWLEFEYNDGVRKVILK
jgi:tRNA threonylcarbamoyladenosine biosynthesis protein TsaE